MNPLASLLSTLAKSMLPTVLNTVLKEVADVLAHRSTEHHKNADEITNLNTRFTELLVRLDAVEAKVEKIEKIIEKIIEGNSEQVKESV